MNGKKLMRAKLVRVFLLVSLLTTALLVAVSVRAMDKPGESDQSTQYRAQTEVDPTTDWLLSDQAAQGAVDDITIKSGDHDDDDDDDGGDCLSIDKTVDKETAAGGDTLTYTIVVTNNCPACGGDDDDDDDSDALGWSLSDDDDDDDDGECADGPVVVVDQIPLHTTYVDGSASDGGTVNTHDDGTTYIKWEFESLPQGESRTMTFRVTVDADTGDATKIVNTACVSAAGLGDDDDDDDDGGCCCGDDDDDDDDDEDSGGCGSVGCPGDDDDDDDDDGDWCCCRCGGGDDDDDDDDDVSGAGAVGCPGDDDDDDDDNGYGGWCCCYNGDDDDDDDDDDDSGWDGLGWIGSGGGDDDDDDGCSCCCVCDTVITWLGCGECDGGVTQLTLRYHGTEDDVLIQVYKGDDQDEDKKLYEGTADSGETFTFIGQDSDNKMGSEISVWVEGTLNTEIHTSCSQDIGPGMVFGDFEVVEGYSKDGGKMCSMCDIGDRVWHDESGNGDQNENCVGPICVTEPGLNDVDIYLYNSAPGTCGEAGYLHRTSTISGTSQTPDGWPDGIYGFDMHSLGLGAGDYWVCVDESTLPDPGTGMQWTSTTNNNPQQVTYTGDDDFSIDFGYKTETTPQSVGTIGDRVWHDENQNGLQDDNCLPVPPFTCFDEMGINGVQVCLYSSDGVDGWEPVPGKDELLECTTTISGTSKDPDGEQDGIYEFDMTLPGRGAGEYWVYVVESSLGAGTWVRSSGNSNPRQVNYPGGVDDFSIDFGYYQGTPTAVTLSSFAANSSAGGSASPLWLGMTGLAMLAAGSLFWAKRRS